MRIAIVSPVRNETPNVSRFLAALQPLREQGHTYWRGEVAQHIVEAYR